MEQAVNGAPTSSKGFVFSRFPLYEHKTPEFKERYDKEYVRYGVDNDYADYLLYLYNRSPIHGAVVKGKTKYILGKGWSVKEGGTLTAERALVANFIKSPNPYESLNKLTKKAILDRKIFGGYYLKIKWNRATGKIQSIYHIGFEKVRTDKYMTQFFVSDNWTYDQSVSRWHKGGRFPQDTLKYQPFNPLNRRGEQILFIRDYSPMMKVYPLPEYVNANADIETDVEISNYNINNIKTGFAAGTMITLFNGEPDPEGKKQIDRDIQGKVGGTDNAGQILINFQDSGTTPPTITPLRPNDLDKQYAQLRKDTTDNIFYAHSVPPMLFGVKTEGQLGGRSEIDTQWESMNNTYVRPCQEEFEEEFNTLLEFCGLPPVLQLTKLEPVGIEITENLITKYLNTTEVRDMLKERLALKDVVAEAAPTQYKALFGDDDRVFHALSQCGEDADDYEMLHQFVGFASVEDLEGLQLEVYNELKNNPKILISDLAEKLKTTEAKLYQALESLSTKNYIAVSYVQEGGKISVRTEITTESLPEESYEIYTKWKYYGPKDDRNRDFCAKLLALNRVYTRAEIDQMNNDLGLDVWKYRGGYYHNPVTDVTQPQCRHTWSQVVLRRKK